MSTTITPERHTLEATYSAAKSATEQTHTEVITARQNGAPQATLNVLWDAYWEANDASLDALDVWSAAVDRWATS